MPWIDRTKKIKQPKPKYVHHSNMSHKYYNSKQWKDMRNVYYKNHPFCEECEWMKATWKRCAKNVTWKRT